MSRLFTLLLAVTILAGLCGHAGAQFTEEAFRRGLSGEPAGAEAAGSDTASGEPAPVQISGRTALAIGSAVAGLIGVGVLVNRRRSPRPIRSGGYYNPAKLLREAARGAGIRPAEMKQLKLLAASADVQNPLVLVLCPSVMAKAIKAGPAKLDKQVIAGLVRRMARSAD